jgi:hypothetical protein
VLIVAPREWWKAAKAEGHRYIYEAAREYAQLTEEQAKALFAFDGWPIEFQAAMAESMYNSPHIKVLSRRVEYFLANGK